VSKPEHIISNDVPIVLLEISYQTIWTRGNIALRLGHSIVHLRFSELYIKYLIDV